MTIGPWTHEQMVTTGRGRRRGGDAGWLGAPPRPHPGGPAPSRSGSISPDVAGPAGSTCRTGRRRPRIAFSSLQPGAGSGPNRRSRPPRRRRSASTRRTHPDRRWPVAHHLDSGYREGHRTRPAGGRHQLHQRPPAGTAVREQPSRRRGWPWWTDNPHFDVFIRLSEVDGQGVRATSATASGGSVRRPTVRSAWNSIPWRIVSPAHGCVCWWPVAATSVRPQPGHR